MTKLNDAAERLRRLHGFPCDIDILQTLILRGYRTTGYSPTVIRGPELISRVSDSTPDRYYSSAPTPTNLFTPMGEQTDCNGRKKNGTALYVSDVKSDL